MLRSNKISFKEFDNEKKIPAAPKFPTPPPHPHNFSNGPSLNQTFNWLWTVPETTSNSIGILLLRIFEIGTTLGLFAFSFR